MSKKRNHPIYATHILAGPLLAGVAQAQEVKLPLCQRGPGHSSIAEMAVDQNRKNIRLVDRGGDIGAAKQQTNRVLIPHPATLAKKKAMIGTCLNAYCHTVDWRYSSPLRSTPSQASPALLRTRPRATSSPRRRRFTRIPSAACRS